MSTIIDGTTGITTDALTSVGSISTSGTITTNGLIVGTETVQLIKLETAKASTSGTNIDFTGIPSWAKKITIMFNNVSLNNTDYYLVQLGDSGGIETTGYSSSSNTSTDTNGFIVFVNTAANNTSGHMVLTLVGSNLWISSHAVRLATGGGSKTLSATLDRVRITTSSGTALFDNGSINILIEGSL
jgi:hypothetical protein